MRTKVCAFKPKGKGYTLYVTKTYHGKSSRSKPQRSRSSNSVLGNIAVNAISYAIVRGLFGMKKK